MSDKGKLKHFWIQELTALHLKNGLTARKTP